MKCLQDLFEQKLGENEKDENQLIEDVRKSLAAGYPVNGVDCFDDEEMIHSCTPLNAISSMYLKGKCTLQTTVTIIDILFKAGCDSEEHKPWIFTHSSHNAFEYLVDISCNADRSLIPIWECLLKNGAKVSSGDGRRIIDRALTHRNNDELHYLLDLGVPFVDEKGTALWSTSFYESQLSKFEVLFRHGSSLPKTKYHEVIDLYANVVDGHKEVGIAIDPFLPAELVLICQNYLISSIKQQTKIDST